ncbi:DNA-binding response regulator [Streptomyces sp. NBC_01498]|uniref:DNA-binding response regulator n=1 Tax=Streptomyces sp. NBC_01498 TaxID=2975870 RepID=UPI002E7BBD7B|nr:DNA-binding response regulator [Streptomyces sp. NBC_01498]WTL26836.1 DNA-binding response regulator [Streptomyces sp. NBC_01498]
MESLRPASRPVRGTHQVAAALAALVRSARRELLTFDDPGSSPGKGLPLPFVEFAHACVRAVAERADPEARPETRAGSGPGSGAGPGPRAGPGAGQGPGVGHGAGAGTGAGAGLRSVAGTAPLPAVPLTVRRIVPRRGLAGLPYELRALARGARQTESIPFKMVLVDRTTAALPLDFDFHFNGLLLIRDPVVVGALVRIHQHWWDSGEELPLTGHPADGSAGGSSPGPAPVDTVPHQGSAPEADTLSPHLRPVLDALLCGLTDEAAAARLGMSPRTYSRRVGELLTALGTTSRFRAGAEAARRGWL